MRRRRGARSWSTPGRGSSAGRRCCRPAWIDRIDYDDEKVYVHRTKDEIKAAPEYDDSLSADMSYRARLATYYGPEGAGYRESETRDHLLSQR